MKVIEGDCLEVMKTLPRNSVDLILTDPPYAMPATYYTGKSAEKRWSDTSIMSAWWRLVLDTAVPLLKPNGQMLTFANGPVISIFWPPMFERFKTLQLAVWWKNKGGTGQPFQINQEYMIMGSAGEWYRHPDVTLHGVSQASPVPPAKRTHGAQKPAELLKMLAKGLCPPGGMVLDPFAGSLSTGYACDELGLDSICIEWDHAPGAPEPQKEMGLCGHA